MRLLTKILFRGLAVVVPFAVTLYVIWWLGAAAENLLGPVLAWLLPEEGWLQYRTGMGVVAGLGLVLLVGMLMYVFLFRKFVEMLTNLLQRIPLVKSLYRGIRDLMDFMADSTDGQSLGQVVTVEMPNGWKMLGFITQNEREGIPEPMRGSEDCVAVYLPMSYQLGGYTLVIPRDRLTPLDMSAEEGMRYALTAGMGERAVGLNVENPSNEDLAEDSRTSQKENTRE